MALMRERIGIFSGFGESRYEIVSKVLLPYHQSRMPLQGAFLVVEHDDLQGRRTGLLGRVTQAMPIGDLFTPAGEDYLVDLVRMQHEVPEEVKEGRLRYRISLRLLGQVTEVEDGRIEYTPAIRQIPHVGARVGFPTEEVTRYIARGCPDQESDPGPVIGHLAVGDLAFDGSDRARNRTIPVHFRMDSLVGRRTSVFARAGMGKSNFVKVLLARLYESGRERIPGTIVIDPEGEYAFANASEPGLLDVPGLKDRVVVFTQRNDYDPKYKESVKGNCRVNLADIDPVDAVSNILPSEKQNMVFANHLRALGEEQWRKLILYLATNGFRSQHAEIAKIVGKPKSNDSADRVDVVISAMINNLVPALRRLHSSKSTLIKTVMDSLRDGKIAILDFSMLASADAALLTSWLLQKVFANNQDAYTAVTPSKSLASVQRMLIPCLAVFEEAQFYLGGRNHREDSPVVRWFKEGRKFSLGSILVTQQPGAIGPELISQCDNFFVFHLLNKIDLEALATANLHFDGDVVTSIGHEPIPGNCFFWSSRGLSFVTCARIMHFGKLVEEARNRIEPVERVEAAVKQKAPEVVLPVREVKLGPGELNAYLSHIVRHTVETEKQLFLFDVQSAGDGKDSNLVAVAADFLVKHLTAALKHGIAKKKAPAGAAELLPLTPADLAAIIAECKLGPADCLREDPKGIAHIVLYRKQFELGKKQMKGTAALQEGRRAAPAK